MNAANFRSARWWIIGLALAGSSTTTCSSDDSHRTAVTATAGSAGAASGVAESAGSGGAVNSAESTGNNDSVGSGGTAGNASAASHAAGGSAGFVAGAENIGGRTIDSGVAGGPSEITSNNIGDLVFGTYCDFLKACESKLGPSFPTRERCLERMNLGLVDGFDHPVFWAKGTSLYQVDRANAEGCLAKLAHAACTDGLPLTDSFAACYGRGRAGTSSRFFLGNQLQHLLDALPECQAAMVGTLVQNACCDYRGGCSPGVFCEDADHDSLGLCQPPGTTSGTCVTSPCQPGLVCVNGACTAPALLDDKCIVNNSYGSGDIVGSNCGAGLYCDESLQPPRCANATKEVGAACDCFGCAPGLYCDYQVSPSLCKSYKQEHEPCANSDRCAADLECVAGTCRKNGSLPIGSECSGSSGGCVAGISGSKCLDDGTGTARCQVPGLLGAGCDPSGKTGKSCASDYDLICDEASRSCQPLPALGQICNGSCADRGNVFCAYATPTDQTGTCRHRVGEGSACFVKEAPDAGSDSSSSSSSSSSGSVDSGCRVDLKCDTTTKICVTRARRSCL